ncbi:MAG: ribosome small subunit-dependent GTPase A [Lachnospiraceae bacterium]|nr:ribosome small subunit-dependent GTPase A [Lachnospiraceae bacterium]
MIGKIVKGIAGFYYVNIEGSGTFECNAKGAFRNEGLKPLVGDNAEIEVVDPDKLKGNVVKILERKNSLIRPACANVDEALVIFAMKTPEPNLNLLDRFLIYMGKENIPCHICFNKADLSSAEEKRQFEAVYEKSGSRVSFTSTKTGEGMEELKASLKGKTVVLAGPSGVGKSSLINLLCEGANMETGSVSKKTERGKHTTRHVELLKTDRDTFILDTPGFTSLDVFENRDDLKYCFREFDPYEGRCRFDNCVHVSEPDCRVKEAVEEGLINRMRYESYVKLFGDAPKASVY